MIKTLKLKFGSNGKSNPLEIDVSPITIFVGPNNSGKSLLLRELDIHLTNGQTNIPNKILNKISLEKFDEQSVQQIIDDIQIEPNADEVLREGSIKVGNQQHNAHTNYSGIENAFKDTNKNFTYLCSTVLRYIKLNLDGSTRLNLIQSKPIGNLKESPDSSIKALFQSDADRDIVRKKIFDAFKKYLCIDPTNVGQLCLNLSTNKPPSNQIERGLDNEAVQFHKKAIPVTHFSDGAKAFIGVLIELIVGKPKILLFDEPEAFLHPPLAHKLGQEVAELITHSNKRVFVSTHSSDFVMGCLESGLPVNIVRLTYQDNTATARLLSSEDILKFMRNPLLRSSGVFNSLFYEYVIVVEGDSDRAFYQEINNRLLQFENNKGIPNCLFISSYGKQSEHSIINSIRKLGIPVAGIVDIDILSGNGEWLNFLKGINIPPIEHTTLGAIRTQINQKIKESGKKAKKDGGINILDGQDKESALNLLEKLSEYGLFVVPHGEVEHWLSNLKVSSRKPQWLPKIFEKMGEKPNDPKYLKPSDNDVWKFISGIRKWMLNQNRKGIPK